MNKKIIQITALITLIPQLTFASFTDVKQSSKYYKAITNLETKNIIQGYKDGTFKPNKNINKAEFYKIAFNNVNYYPEKAKYKTFFKDVDKNIWFAPYIKKALDLNLITYNPTSLEFHPEQPITRIQAIKTLLYLKGIPTPFNNTTKIKFKDIKEDYPYKNIVIAIQNNNIYKEKEYLQPNAPLTRAETAYLIDEINNLTTNTKPSTTQLTKEEQSIINNTKFPIFANIWEKINTTYIDKNKIDKEKLMYSAIKGMVNSLNDPYSKFKTPEESQNLQDNLNGNFTGIGIIIEKIKNNFEIITTLKNSPAEKAKLQSGDIIKKVNNTDITNDDIDELLNKIKGKEGTSVKLEIQRKNKIKIFTIKREKLTLSSIQEPIKKTKINIPNNIKYIKINQFTESTNQEFENSIETAIKNKQSIILDLRNNPGGYVDSAYNIIGHFIKKGTIITQIKTPDTIEKIKSQGKGELQNTKTIILVNKNTASAAEIVATALNEINNIPILGETTYGKGTVQEVTIYTDNSLLKLSIAKWLTPKGNSINHKGITPTITINPTKNDLLGKTDTQLLKAIQVLK